MTNISVPRWETKRTDETRRVEEVLRSVGFQKVDAYRYNPASIRVRVVDPQFEGLRRLCNSLHRRAFPSAASLPSTAGLSPSSRYPISRSALRAVKISKSGRPSSVSRRLPQASVPVKPPE